MITRTLAITGCLLGAPVTVVSAQTEFEKSADFLLIRRDHRVEPIRPAQINERELIHLDPVYGWVTVDLTDCVALLDPAATTAGRHKGLLRLADGQVFPGEALSGAQPHDDVLVWNHAWLGRMEVPLDRIMAVAFVEGATPAPLADADVLLLANGDRLEGFVVALGDPISIEVQTDDQPQIIEIPLERAASVTMVTNRQRPAGWRVWLTDGTVLEVVRILLTDGDLVRLVGTRFVGDRELDPLPLSELAAALFDPDGMIPFALLSPVKVTGPLTRYVVPQPQALDESAALGMSRIELRGPLTVDYALPPGGWYFHAEAQLARAARGWGDCELVIRDDRAELFRVRLNAENPAASIGITVHGTRLTIELTEGLTGPIQDHVVLSRAMLLRSDQ